MAGKIVLVLNKGDFPFYLEELCMALRTNFSGSLFRFHLQPDKKINTPAIELLKAPMPSFDSTKADLYIPEINNLTSFENDTLFLNLTDNISIDIPIKYQSLITPCFFVRLQRTYSPDIAIAILNGNAFITSEIVYSSEGGVSLQIDQGNFKIIAYNYHTTLRNLTSGTIQLIISVLSKELPPISHSLTFNEEKRKDLEETDIQKLKKKLLSAKRKHRIEQLFFTHKWNIGVIDAPIEQVALHPDKKWTVNWMKEATGDQFNADPFGTVENGDSLLLYEHYRNRKGVLHFQFNAGDEQLLLEENQHLSYPYIFEDELQKYCIPEQQASGNLILYKLNVTKKSLEEHCNILKGFRAVDPSIVYYSNKWWLFCTNAENTGADIRLYIFHSEQLCGPWKPHAQNPVKTDILSARPGGHFFIHKGQLYRPSQDSSNSYGGSLVINRVDLLSETAFRETAIHRLLPHQLSGIYKEGWHTISSFGTKTLVDGKRKRFSPGNLLSIFRKK